jgi:predicted acetyltransferase
VIARKHAHELVNLLQVLMSQIDLGQNQQAKNQVRKITDYINVHTEERDDDATDPDVSQHR